jgi:hypothetical protein
MTTQPTTLAQQFAAEYAKGVVPAMMKTLDSGKKRSKALLVLVMAVTYWHVASFLVWHTAFGWFGLAVPLIVDLSMLQMLDVLQTRGMRKPARQAATVFAAVLGLISGAFNVIAADDAFTAFGFASLVLIAVATKVVVSLMGPDFEAIEQVEQAVTVTAAPAVDEELKARRSEAARQAAATRRQNAAEAARKAEEAKARRRAGRVAPTSPGMPAVDAPTAYELNAIYA